jgi:hypothetical protein
VRPSPPTRLDTQRDHASFLVGRGAEDLLVVKANQPILPAQLAGLPWRQIPVMDRTRDHGHGRIEIRTLKVAAVAGLCFPHAAQAIQLIRRVGAPGSRGWRTVTAYAATSLTLGAASPTQLAGWLGGPLEDREPAALDPRRDLQRRRLPRAHQPASPG